MGDTLSPKAHIPSGHCSLSLIPCCGIHIFIRLLSDEWCNAFALFFAWSKQAYCCSKRLQQLIQRILPSFFRRGKQHQLTRQLDKGGKTRAHREHLYQRATLRAARLRFSSSGILPDISGSPACDAAPPVPYCQHSECLLFIARFIHHQIEGLAAIVCGHLLSSA